LVAVLVILVVVIVVVWKYSGGSADCELWRTRALLEDQGSGKRKTPMAMTTISSWDDDNFEHPSQKTPK